MRSKDVTLTGKMNELKLDIPHPNNMDKVFILLEGNSDVRLFRKLYPHRQVKLETIPGGWIQLEKGLRELDELSKQLIGIRDADFAHLDNQQPRLPNLFFTDLHDSEMLMVASDQTFSAIIHEFCDLPKTEHNLIREKLLNALRAISYLRWYNERNGLGLNFEGIKLGDLFEPESNQINHQAYLGKVLAKSKRTDIGADQLLADVARLNDEAHHDFQLCNGHDFMNVLAKFLNTKIESGISEDRVCAHFRTAYQLDEFSKTKLHDQVKNWAVDQRITFDFTSA